MLFYYFCLNDKILFSDCLDVFEHAEKSLDDITVRVITLENCKLLKCRVNCYAFSCANCCVHVWNNKVVFASSLSNFKKKLKDVDFSAYFTLLGNRDGVSCQIFWLFIPLAVVFIVFAAVNKRTHCHWLLYAYRMTKYVCAILLGSACNCWETADNLSGILSLLHLVHKWTAIRYDVYCYS